MKKRLLIAGGTGFIGSAIVKATPPEEWEITVLSRTAGPGRIVWNPAKGNIDFHSEPAFDAILNLAGASITDGRWTPARKNEFYQSRISSCHTLEKYLKEGLITTPFYLGVSGVGIYGDRGTEVVEEETIITNKADWFVKTVVDWEAAHSAIAALGIRTVILRIGIALSKKGGAIKEILGSPPFGVLAYFGNGNQIWPWIHMEDLIRIIFFSIDQAHVSGTFLASAPYPVTNKELTKTMNHFISPKRIVMGVPRFILSAILGEMHRVLFESCNASAAKIQKEGFVFNFPKIDGAIKDLL